MHKYKIEDRRRRVASLLAQSMTETEIAKELNVDQSTISRDIRVLSYKKCLVGIEEVKRRAWEIFNKSTDLSTRDKLLALKLVIDSNESKFALFKEGPAIMQVKSMEERLSNIEFRQDSREFTKRFDRVFPIMNNGKNGISLWKDKMIIPILYNDE